MPKILMVDDVELFLELERSYLEGCGYDLVTAASGEEALRRLDKIAPDVMLIDFFMPGMDGDEVCRLVRKNPRWQKLPILMVTAAGKPDEVQRCLQSGCDDYITKPVNKQELREKVQRLLGVVKRRTEERIAVKMPVQLREGGRLHVANASNISLTGILLKTSAVLEENSVVEISFDVQGDQPLTLYGKIKRASSEQNDGAGVYFIYPDSGSKRALEALVRNKRNEQREQAGIDAQLNARLKKLEEECDRLRAAQEDAMRRIGELEQENLEFANQLVQVEDVNNNLTNLYIASSRLHSTLDREETLEIIKEVVINFVGAEKFAVLLLDQSNNQLRLETSEGFDSAEKFPEIPLGEGVIGDAAKKRENYFAEAIGEGSDDLLAPIIAIPLIIQEQMIGVLAIYRLFIQKEQLESIDYQLFSMLGEHAASALFSSTLYSRSERKRQTYQGFVDLLLK